MAITPLQAGLSFAAPSAGLVLSLLLALDSRRRGDHFGFRARPSFPRLLALLLRLLLVRHGS